jgi:hypothetical protein
MRQPTRTQDAGRRPDITSDHLGSDHHRADQVIATPSRAFPLRRLLAVCLVVAALGSVVGAALQPAFPEGPGARLAAIEEAGTGGALSAFLFTAVQLPWMVAVVGIAWLAHRGSCRVAAVGGMFAATGAFGHAVFGGAMLVSVLMARDAADRAAMVRLLGSIESSALFLPFMLAGLLGTVLGTVLLGIALWRSRVVARWVPIALWAFLVVEFVGSNLSDYATYLSGVCLTLAFGALAHRTWTLATPRSTVDGSAQVQGHLGR